MRDDAYINASLIAALAIGLLGCSLFDKKSKGKVNPEDVRSNPTFQHGFGSGGFGLLDAPLGQTAIATSQAGEDSTESGVRRAIPLIYTGESLVLDGSCAKDDVWHVSEVWTQRRLYALFSGSETKWHQSAIESLEETDPKSHDRSRYPVHPNLVKRLGKGYVDPNLWTLNGVRFRIASPAVQEATGSTPDLPMVQAQIKLNYELDLWKAGANVDVGSASFIHSIAIRPEHVSAFRQDLDQLAAEDRSPKGCKVLNILNKYVASEGLPPFVMPRGSYFFLHTNIFDLFIDPNSDPMTTVTPTAISEWRFTEHKIVSNDEGPIALRLGKARPLRKIVDSYGSPPHLPFPDRSLRIVPMRFPKFYTTAEPYGGIRLATDQDPVSLWFSGSRTDMGQNVAASNQPIKLLLNPDDPTKDVAKDHPSRRHEETFTCAQCHLRQVGTKVHRKDPLTGKMQTVYGWAAVEGDDENYHFVDLPLKPGDFLQEIPSMNVRHIGYGDGGNRECNGFFGKKRPGYRASLSTYLLQVASGHFVNQSLSPVFTRKPPRNQTGSIVSRASKSMEAEGASVDAITPLKSFDSIRCMIIDGMAGQDVP